MVVVMSLSSQRYPTILKILAFTRSKVQIDQFDEWLSHSIRFLDQKRRSWEELADRGVQRNILAFLRQFIDRLRDLRMNIVELFNERTASEIQDELRFRASRSIRLGNQLSGSMGARKRRRSQSMGYDPAVGQRLGNGRPIEEPSRNP